MVTMEEIIINQQFIINKINESKNVIEKENIKLKNLKNRQQIFIS